MPSPRKSPSDSYPKPQEVGGRLIRTVVSELRKAGQTLPLTSHILIAVSGGSDSMALAHLLLKYGRRAVDPSRILLLHVNHAWRSEVSNRDAAFVARFGRKWGVPVILHKLKPPGGEATQGHSWEETAREARKAIFEQEARKQGAVVLTAHQADDLAETVLWRLFTGAAETHTGGIAVRHGVELRPLLRVRKALLLAYLKEERQAWREDSTNHSGRFLRSQMRRDLMPVIERLFPRAPEHLVKLALQAQGVDSGLNDSGFRALSALLGASGIRMRRSHSAEIERSLKPGKRAAMDLPDGWRLSREGAGRWVLEDLRILFGD